LSLPDYPFEPRRFAVRPGIAMSYLDEGPRDGEVVVMLHGNPSWSYYWRHLVSALRDPASGKAYRCIVPDHVGMGLSDKPDDRASAMPRYDYTLQSRIDDLQALLRHAGVDDATPVTLVVHDWGGMIGFGWALAHMGQVKRLVILNTAAFPMPATKRFPRRLALGRDSRFGGWLIRRFNLFARGAARFGTTRRLPPAVRRAYSSVYDGWDDAIATLRFMQDIPLREGDRAWPLLVQAAERLPEYADRPAFIGWGLRDFVFDRHCLDAFRAALPQAEVHAFEDAGHYVLEDRHETLVPAIRAFLDTHPP
jgi:haloalkane dehalogenase